MITLSSVFKRTELSLLAALFFGLPIVFSHLPYLFGPELSFDYFGNYEGSKKAFFTVVVGILFFESIVRNYRRLGRMDGLFLGILATVSAVQYYQGGSLESVLFGTGPLFFGSVFPLMLWALYFVLRQTDRSTVEIARKWLLISLFFVTGYAVAQMFGYDPIGSYSATFSLDRVFSTLGNPNMLAGYSLLLLPFIVRERLAWMCALSVLALLNILASGSASLALFAFFYVLWYFFRAAPINKLYYFLLLAIASVSLIEIAGLPGLLSSKLLSLETRGALLVQAWSLFATHPWALIFGFPSDVLMNLLDSERIELVRLYVSDEIAIGNFHSLPVDILTRLGVVMFSFLVYATSLFMKGNRSSLAFETVILFGIFSLLHMPEVTHFGILLLALTNGKAGKK